MLRHGDIVPYMTEVTDEGRERFQNLLISDPTNEAALIEALAHQGFKKKIAAGGIVFPSMDQLDRFYICRPAKGYGPWEFPKGHIDKGESLKQAAVREVYEETGIHAQVLPGRHAYIGKPPKDQFGSFTHIFLMVQTGGGVHLSWEVDKCELMTWEEAVANFSISIHGGNKRGIAQIKTARKIVQQYYLKS